MAAGDFRLDTRYSSRQNPFIRPAAVIFAVVAIIIIISSMTTNLAARLLPMEDKYLVAIIPQAPDGSEPLSLTALEEMCQPYPCGEPKENSLIVSGKVTNRTQYTLSGVQAVVELKDKFNFVKQSVGIPLDPKDVPAQGMANFQTTIMLHEPPSAFGLRFQLIDGPFIPHRDEHTFVAPAQAPESPASKAK
jgi:hypothetical protein